MQDNYLLLNFEQPLLDGRHVSLRHDRLLHLLIRLSINNFWGANLVLNRLKLQAVESLDVLLSEVLELAFACNRNSGLIMFPDSFLVQYAQESEALILLLIDIKLVI
jgi:hypothetical protein